MSNLIQNTRELIAAAKKIIYDDFLSSIGGALVGFLQSGVGAVLRTMQDKQREAVSVFDFMTPEQIADVESNTGAIDVTAAWSTAQNASDKVEVPAGTHRLTDFRPKTSKKFIGAGRRGTKIKQGDGAKYAFNALSDASTGQLISIALKDVHFVGAEDATVSVFNAEANGVYAVYDSDFDYSVETSYQALRIVCPDANNVYNCKFKLSSNHTISVSALTAGVYNTYDLFLTGTQANKAIESLDWSAKFERVITEAGQVYSGQNCLIDNAIIENWSSPLASEIGVQLNGYNNKLLSTGVITVPNAKVNIAYKLANTCTIVGARVVGTYPATCPQFSLQLDPTAKGSITDFVSDAPVKVELTSNATTIRNFDWIGDCSTVTDSQRKNGRRLFVRVQPPSGTTVSFADNQDAIVLQPAAAIEAINIALPPTPINGQVVRVSTSQAISSVSVTASSGQNIAAGAYPASLAAGQAFSMIWESSVNYWWAI